MANPGEFFPQQFAMGILQLKQQRDQQAAQLAQMRQQAAATNFLENQKLALAQQQQAFAEDQANTQNAMRAREAAVRSGIESNQVAGQFALGAFNAQTSRLNAESEAKAREAADAARIKQESDRLGLERDQVVERSVADFGRTGNAFIPTYAAAQVPKLLSQFNAAADSGITGSYHYTTIDLPGSGTIVQRLGGPGDEKTANQARLIDAQIDHLTSQDVLNAKRAQHISMQEGLEQQKLGLLAGKVDQSTARMAGQHLDALRKIATDRAKAALASGDDVIANKIYADPSTAFPEGSAERTGWANSSLIFNAYQQQQLKGMSGPATPNLKALEAAGVDKEAFGAPKYAGQTPTATAPAPTPAPAPATPSISDADRTLIRSLGEIYNNPKTDPEARASALRQLQSIKAKYIR